MQRCVSQGEGERGGGVVREHEEEEVVVGESGFRVCEEEDGEEEDGVRVHQKRRNRGGVRGRSLDSRMKCRRRAAGS